MWFRKTESQSPSTPGRDRARPGAAWRTPLTWPGYWLAGVYVGSTLYAVIFGLLSTDSVHKLWGAMAACGYLVAGLLAVAFRTWKPRLAADLPLAVAFVGALLIPLLVMAGRGIDKPEVDVVVRSASLLIHHGTPYQDASALGRTTDPNAYNPYLPVMALFGLPRAIFGGGFLTDPRVWFGLCFLTVFSRALRAGGAGDSWRWTILAIGSPIVALELSVGGTDVPMVAFLCLGFGLLAKGLAAVRPEPQGARPLESVAGPRAASDAPPLEPGSVLPEASRDRPLGQGTVPPEAVPEDRPPGHATMPPGAVPTGHPLGQGTVPPEAVPDDYPPGQATVPQGAVPKSHPPRSAAGLLGTSAGRPLGQALTAAGVALGIASGMKATAWPGLAVAIVVLVAAVGWRAAGRFTAVAVAVTAVCVGPFLVHPRALVINTIEFPLGLANVQSAAASPLPGHLLSQTGHAGHTIAVALLVLAGVAITLALLLRPPRSAPRAVFLLVWAMSLMFLLAPSTRFGYFIYPGTLALWLLAVLAGRNTGAVPDVPRRRASSRGRPSTAMSRLQ